MRKDNTQTLCDSINEEISQNALDKIKNMLHAGYEIVLCNPNGNMLFVSDDTILKLKRCK